MNKPVFLRGMAQLLACCKDRDLDAEMQTMRADCYWRDLSHLSDAAFLFACEEGRKREWFPSIGDLLELAARCPVNDARAQRLLAGKIAPQFQASYVTPPLALYEALIQEFPRQEGEHSLMYLVRIAEKAGVPQGGKGGAWPLDAQKFDEAVEAVTR